MIYIIHDNIEWLYNLLELLKENNLSYTEWNLKLDTSILNSIDFTKEPPQGIFYNRISASSHTRNARYALEHTKMIVQWLEKWDRRIINGSKSLELELSKFRQYLELSKQGVLIPKTYIATSKKEIIELSNKHFNFECIVKDNRSGSGIGVKLIKNKEQLENYLEDASYIEPIDGITLIQQYIESPEPYINRVEIINHEFIYMVKVNTSDGFNLCPADTCSINSKENKFQIILNVNEKELIKKYINVTNQNDILICGIEFIRDKNGLCWTYDLNCNTNYNSKAEQIAGVSHKALTKLIDLMK